MADDDKPLHVSANDKTNAMAETKRYLRLPPEMSDGEHWSIHPSDGMDAHDANVLAGQIMAWANDTQADPGDVLVLHDDVITVLKSPGVKLAS